MLAQEVALRDEAPVEVQADGALVEEAQAGVPEAVVQGDEEAQ